MLYSRTICLFCLFTVALCRYPYGKILGLATEKVKNIAQSETYNMEDSYKDMFFFSLTSGSSNISAAFGEKLDALLYEYIMKQIVKSFDPDEIKNNPDIKAINKFFFECTKRGGLTKGISSSTIDVMHKAGAGGMADKVESKLNLGNHERHGLGGWLQSKVVEVMVQGMIPDGKGGILNSPTRKGLDNFIHACVDNGVLMDAIDGTKAQPVVKAFAKTVSVTDAAGDKIRNGGRNIRLGHKED